MVSELVSCLLEGNIGVPGAIELLEESFRKDRELKDHPFTSPEWNREQDEMHRVAGTHGIHPNDIRTAFDRGEIRPIDWAKIDKTATEANPERPLSFGKFNKIRQRWNYGPKDMNSIAKAYKKGTSLPAPIVAVHPCGKHTIEAGNTRSVLGVAKGIKMLAHHVVLPKCSCHNLRGAATN